MGKEYFDMRRHGLTAEEFLEVKEFFGELVEEHDDHDTRWLTLKLPVMNGSSIIWFLDNNEEEHLEALRS